MKTRRNISILLCICIGWCLLVGINGRTLSTQGPVAAPSILLDPGHGGEDGGTAASDGTLEKNINLAIALDLRDLLQICGFPVSMTRDVDISIHDAGNTTARQKKVSDMQNRLKLYEQAHTVIAIHQNHYGVSKYKGAQVFYSANHEAGQTLATSIQQSISQRLQTDNTRQIKKATDGIFLLHHTKRPAVLVECGFLSNPEELALLKMPVYQQQIAFCVMAGYFEYMVQE
ncbi:MAG: N-acetylmuramoyl-L-alanine amidase [Clostridia bacterium]|nr:N-acetylmuramoyl-L-alanine amidase [Clostridia bacterium]